MGEGVPLCAVDFLVVVFGEVAGLSVDVNLVLVSSYFLLPRTRGAAKLLVLLGLSFFP